MLAGIALIITALTGMLSVILTYMNRRKIKEVHILVNSKMAAALTRILQLEGALEDADVDVPADKT